MNIKKNISRIMTVAMIAGMMGAYVPMANAASVTNLKDEMSRLKTGETSTHTISFTLPYAWVATDSDILITYTGQSAFSFTGTGDASTSTCATDPAVTASNNVITVDSESVVCALGNIITITGFSAVNPTAGAFTFAITGGPAAPNAFTGTGAGSILADDQVTVTATVDPTLTFDVDTNASCAEANGTGDNAIAFGTLVAGTLYESGTSVGSGGATDYICMNLDTNASGGAVVEFTSLNDGFSSVSSGYVMGDALITAAGSAGTNVDVLTTYAAYDGLWIENVTTAAETTTPAGYIREETVVASLTTDSGATALTLVTGGTWDIIADTGSTTVYNDINTGPVDGTGYQSIVMELSARAIAVTPAAADYTNTLTFRATGTF